MFSKTLFDYLTGGAISRYQVPWFFAAILLLPVVGWVLSRFRGLPPVSITFFLNELLPFYTIIVVVANVLHVSIWFVFLFAGVNLIALLFGAALMRSRILGIKAVRFGMLSGAFLVYLLTTKLSLFVRIPAAIFAYTYLFNVWTHQLHNLIVPPLLEKVYGNAPPPADVVTQHNPRPTASSNSPIGTRISVSFSPADTRIAFEFSVIVDAPRNEVFELIADLVTAARVSRAPDVRMVSDPPISCGTRWISNHYGKRVEYTAIIHDCPHRLQRQFTGALTGVIDDTLEAVGERTRVTRRVHVEGAPGTKEALAARHTTYFDRLKVYLEKRTQRRREEAELERDSKDERIIALDRARIRGQIVPAKALDQLLSSVTLSSGAANIGRFATVGYEHAQVLKSGSSSSRILRSLFGSVDMYVTCLYGENAFAYNRAVEEFRRQAERDLIGLSRRAEVIFPKEGHEEQYWKDAVALLEKPECEVGCRHLWTKSKCFLILTGAHPSRFTEQCFPLVSIDISEILPIEVRWIVISIGRLCSKTHVLPHGMPGGFGRDLFEQNVSRLPGAGDYPRKESALDILSLPVLITPSVTIDFKYCDERVRKRFESICEETLSSRPGALPYSIVLRDRKKQRASVRRSVPSLPDEELIREFWN